MIDQAFRVAVDKLPAVPSDRLKEAVVTAEPSVAPALAISIWQSGAPWYQAYSGWIDPATKRVPVGPSTLFDLASVTKLFTATAFLRLANDRRVGLDDQVTGVIPELSEDGPRAVDGGQEPLSRRHLPVPTGREDWTVDAGDVTFRQLLTHTSGMAPWRSVFRDGGLDAVWKYPFVARPGQEFHYSDLGYMALGEAVSRVFGAPLDEAMQALIRDRLGLDSLTYSPTRRGRPQERIAPTSFDHDWRGRRCWGEVEDENAAGLGGVAGHAGLFATVEDVARFGVAWLRRDPRLRLDTLWTTATSNQTRGMTATRGLGWQVQPTDHLTPLSESAYGHAGFTGTSLAVDPDRDLVVALLSNRVYAGRTHQGIDQTRLQIHRIIADAFGSVRS